MKSLLLTLFCFTLLSSQNMHAEKLKDYQPASGISGNISSVGSDTLANMMSLWAEEFRRFYPNVNVQVQAAGSSTAPPALTEGTSQLGPMSRKMKKTEMEAFERHFGYKPTAIPVAVDALAVYVHKDNPIKGLSIKQVDAIFSSTLRCGATRSISNWNDLGLKGALGSRNIQLYGRNSVSGTYGYFKKRALCKGDFKNTVNEQPGSSSVIQSVSSSKNAIGYSGIGYLTSSVKAVPISKKGKKYIEANKDNALKGKYPLTRMLYVYVNKHPSKPLGALEKEFIKMILSSEGQAIVNKDGYISLPKKQIKRALKLIN